ncbi:MAG: hypothetical protein D6712_14165 [Chloroflexi bacterium]|nr:MAG: hypothetical protein D6712_14165 [Chloroflexota bacterium]
MPVLLLAQGQPEAKEALRKAIEARYGAFPPHLSVFQATFKGKARVKVGPVKTWIPLDLMMRFHFPQHFRVDFTVRPFGLPVQRGVEAFDGEKFYTLRGNKDIVIVEDARESESMRRRLWAMAALLLTPLGEQYVQLEMLNDGYLEAHNMELGDTVQLHLNANGALEEVRVSCYNPDSETEQLFRLSVSTELIDTDGIMMPQKINAYWDDAPYFETEPKSANNNDDISVAVFRLAED